MVILVTVTLIDRIGISKLVITLITLLALIVVTIPNNTRRWIIKKVTKVTKMY